MTENKGNIEVRDGRMHIDLPAIADDALVAASQRAAARIEAVKQIKVMALAVTNPGDWTDQNGKPYIMASGAEKIANLFAVNWTLDEPTCETEEDGNFTYSYRGTFTMPGRTITADGSRSSKDPFFTKYEYRDKVVDGKVVRYSDGNPMRERFAKPISEIDRRDVKMAALTNCLGNGISRILGIRNMTWEDLKKYADIDQDKVSKVEYKNKKKEEEGKGNKMREPGEKATAGKPGQKAGAAPKAATAATASAAPDPNRKAEVAQITTLKILLAKTGTPEDKWPAYCSDFIGNGVELKDLADMSAKHAGGLILALQGEQGGQGNLLK